MAYSRVIFASLLIGLLAFGVMKYANTKYDIDLNGILIEKSKAIYDSVISYLIFNPSNNVGSDLKKDGSNKEVILTADELRKYTGDKGGPVYIAFLGKVYDVSAGRQHYGPGGGYHFFSGKDASRAFVSGDFSEKGLVDDVSGLSNADMLGIKQWIEFYEKDYKYVGKLVGRYYDDSGKTKKELKKVWHLILEAEEWETKNNDLKKIFPPCNSEWTQESGGRVWCTELSGGINRHWVGVPRIYHKPGSTETRCVCVRNTGPPSDSSSSQSSHKNRGDLDNPNLRDYPGCNPTSDSCPMTD